MKYHNHILKVKFYIKLKKLCLKIKKSKNKVTICMGSQSDWPTLKLSSNILKDFSVVHE